MASRPAVATSAPSGWNAIAYSARVWPSCSSSSLQVSTSQSRHDVSNDAVPANRPDGWKATRESLPAWPLSSPTALVLSRDHSLATPSQPPERMLAALLLCVEFVCGCQASPETRSVWPRSVWISWQLGMRHSFTTALHEPVAHMSDPGENAMNETGRSSPKLESWFWTPERWFSSEVYAATSAVGSWHRFSASARSRASLSVAFCSE
mmetsp:Transcript_53700/g.117138  ORF Transcript_53700/g.117138 Transcript_53700/m.117138 type:complete len:208 (+) Transcript_53700:860-1483(+)